MYNIIGYYKRDKNEYLLIQDKNDTFITNGVYKWKPTEKRLNKLTKVTTNDININKVKEKFNLIKPAIIY